MNYGDDAAFNRQHNLEGFIAMVGRRRGEGGAYDDSQAHGCFTAVYESFRSRQTAG